MADPRAARPDPVWSNCRHGPTERIYSDGAWSRRCQDCGAALPDRDASPHPEGTPGTPIAKWRADTYRRYLRGEIDYQEMRRLEDHIEQVRDARQRISTVRDGIRSGDPSATLAELDSAYNRWLTVAREHQPSRRRNQFARWFDRWFG